MDEQNVTVTVESEVELGPKELSRVIGEQLIVEGEGAPFAYLAGIAFDGMRGNSDVVDILVEYIRNEQSLDLEEDEVYDIKEMLRRAHE